MAKTPDEPLTLTVHSLPKADAPDTSAATRGRAETPSRPDW